MCTYLNQTYVLTAARLSTNCLLLFPEHIQARNGFDMLLPLGCMYAKLCFIADDNAIICIRIMESSTKLLKC